MSATKLAGIADRLREKGKVQTAYICQRRAVELAPENAAPVRHLGELAHILGRREEARNAYERYLDLEPNDAEIRHLLVSLRDQTPPPRVPNECIEQLYHRFSSFYEANMCDELGYAGPDNLAATIEEVIGDRRELSILDLGCGTGMAGRRIKSRASQLVGVDLSTEMIELARQQDVYDRLEVAEATDWLGRASESFDLIMACDTLIYFGDLQQVIAPAVQRLKPNGVIAFSVERADRPPYRLTDSGRYVHHVEHVEKVANDLGLRCSQREAFLRMEYGAEVTGLFVVMTAA
jgi:predicted TPR repeat methyltransferase